jgi:HTH-type transcriptional regulator/antitoxin HigA
MSIVLANPAEMIRKGAPRLIRNDRELAEYTRELFELTSKKNLTRHEEEAIELLTLLIERYESERSPIRDADPVEVLQFLLESNGLAQRDIAPELGSESTVSLVLAGKRQLNRDHIARLSRRFSVSPAVFFGVSSHQERGFETAKNELFIERREQGVYAIRKPNSDRASAILPTQAEAIERAREMYPDAAILVERVRDTNVGGRDKWRPA